MDLINAKIAGNKELVAELEKQAAIQQIQAELMDQAGLSEQAALTKAKQMVEAKKALEDQAAAKPDRDGKIKGYSRERQGGADEARQRAADRVTTSRRERDAAVKEAFGTLGPKDPATNPLAAQAGKNAAAADPKDTGGPAAQAAQIVTQILPQLLSVLSGS